jgi:hypothetical protein
MTPGNVAGGNNGDGGIADPEDMRFGFVPTPLPLLPFSTLLPAFSLSSSVLLPLALAVSEFGARSSASFAGAIESARTYFLLYIHRAHAASPALINEASKKYPKFLALCLCFSFRAAFAAAAFVSGVIVQLREAPEKFPAGHAYL